MEQIEAIQRTAIHIIYDYTYDMPYNSALYVAQIPIKLIAGSSFHAPSLNLYYNRHPACFILSLQHETQQLLRDSRSCTKTSMDSYPYKKI